MIVVKTRGLTKSFGRAEVVRDLDLDIPEGELFGLLGPNGSGKTTTLRMLLGLIYASKGEIEILGRRMPREARRVLPHVGAMVEGPAFYPHLSATTNLALLDAAGPRAPRRTRRDRIEQALFDVGLGDVGRKPVKAYSSGMRQRLGLAAALLRKNRLLVLDEPTNALDPHGAHGIRQLLARVVSQGTTVLVSSHFLAEVEMICSRAAIVHRGRLVTQGTMDELLAPTGRVWLSAADMPRALQVLGALRGVVLDEQRNGSVALTLSEIAPEIVNEQLVRNGVSVRELAIERPTLEDVFMKLTAQGVHEEPRDVVG